MGLSALAVNLNRALLGPAGKKYSQAENNYFWRYNKANECGHNVMRILQHIAGAPLVHQNKLLSWTQCRYSDGYPPLEAILNQWKQLGIERISINPDFPPEWSEIEAWGPWFFIWRLEQGGHTGVFIPERPGWYGARNENDRPVPNGLFNFLERMRQIQRSNNAIVECYLYRFPNNKLNNCHSAKFAWGWDSTMKYGTVRHMWICCWKEKLPGEAPWRSRTTPYACLNWDETRGTTWDTLISPRANMAGCTSVVFIQSCTTNLQHGGNKIIEIRGSTDDGRTWQYHIETA